MSAWTWLPVPGGPGTLLVVGVLGAVVAVVCLREPVWAAVVLLATMFLRLALPHVGTDPFVAAYALVLAALALRWIRTRAPAPGPGRGYGSGRGPGRIELAMAAYVGWCVVSMVLPHQYPPVQYPLDGSEVPIPRFILISTVIPFTMFVLGRTAFDRPRTVRLAMWSVLAFGAYSTLVSILQFHAPALVWPRYIVDSPNWENRANGVLNQPVGNGIVLVVGFVVALVLATDDREPRWRRALVLLLYPAAAAYAVFLTHTRAIYLAFVAVLLLGAWLARGFRAPFVVITVTTCVVTVANWSTFASSDRKAGGIASQNELHDRLNAIATGLWGFEQKPWFGWGIGRYVALNTFHHRQWSQDVPWKRGLGIPAHLNELGILAELGLVGLVLWLCVLVPVIALVVRAYRTLPDHGPAGRRSAFVALAALTTQVIAGSSADLRLLDFPTALVMLLVGIAAGGLRRAAGSDVGSAGTGAATDAERDRTAFRKVPA